MRESSIKIFLLLILSITSQAQTLQYVSQNCKEDLSQPITAELKSARQIFTTLTGTALPFCDDRLKKMAVFLKSNQPRKATAVATADALFYDIRVRDMAMKWCNLNESVRNEVNDCVAMVVGGVRDGMDIREIVSGNYHYEVDTAKLSLANVNDYPTYSLDNNNHFSQIVARGYSMFYLLKKYNYQKIIKRISNNQNEVITMDDPGGLISSQGFLSAHARAGTNRRMLQYSMMEFLCTPIQELADNTLSDTFVGPDVDRQPAGSAQKYLTTCKACHAPMDSMRPAFAYVDTDDNGKPFYTPGNVRDKYKRAGTGYIPASSAFNNLAITGSNSKLGWRSATSGTGIKDFSKMLTESRAFSTCMVKSAFRTICGADPAPEHANLIETYASDMEKNPVRDIRQVFERLALRPECVGQ